MKIEADFIMELIRSDVPVQLVGKRVSKIWSNEAEKDNKIGDYYYKGEEEIRDFEEFILKSYWEFYDRLAKACLEEKDIFQLYPDSTIVVMDGMSIRESALLYKSLKSKGYNVKHDFNFSAVPSDTEFFREKVKKPISEFLQINNPKNIRLAGDERYIWSYFPDVMLDKIKTGHTVISSLEEMYKIVEKIVLEILSKLNSEKIIITSDHGYIRTEAGYVFPVSEKAKRKFQQIFGSKRYVKMDTLDVKDLIEESYVKEFNGYYITKSRYLWPVPGRYSIYIHGGLSLMECFTPVLIVEKER
ncbi:MAG: hypothetical protein DRP08_02005 [Candidatus Aenigmatarchaeota archaeon]|nr:MAG: hypothetical protein DRP08_02005 [Candidatus Aenigmarchaeota archaeon]